MPKSVPIKEFRYGTINSVEDTAIPRGSSSGSLNWITQGTKIELRRGYNILGATENVGTGRITGLGVGRLQDGSDILFRTRKRKIEYLNIATDDWVEVGTNALPEAVIAEDTLGEDISFEAYTNVTGEQLWLNSPNTGPIKIMTANPTSYTEMYVLGTNYKARMRIKGGRMYAWNRFGNPRNKVDLFGSKLDVKADSDYTQISAEVIGIAGTTNYSGILAFKAAGVRRVCFQITFTDGTETFADNGDGTLTGTAGGTGTINYTTGEYSITFNGLAAGGVTATYRWADDSAGGIADFAYSATRVATEGFVLKQAGGGDFQNLMSLNGVEYCLHANKTWAVTISGDDLDVTNLIFRSKVGIPNHRAAVETSDGIYYIDDTDESDPHFRVLTLETQSTEVVPRSVSKQLKIADVKVGINLAGYRFDKAASIEFGDLVLFSCRTSDSEINNRVFVYNKINKANDVIDYYASCFAVCNGNLVCGDSITDNVYTLFSGTDDNQSSIANYWNASLDNLGYAGMKRVVELTMAGEIGPEQSLKVLMSVDRGAFVEVRSKSDIAAGKHAIEGDGDYVDRTQRVSIGAFTLGRGAIGGGGDGLEAYNYRRQFRISLDKFEFVKFRVEATRLGYVSVTEFTFTDVRVKRSGVPNRYRVGR